MTFIISPFAQTSQRKRKFKNVELCEALAPKSDVKVDFDPAKLLSHTLIAHFGDVAHFFHDQLGGNIIGVVWSPQVNVSMILL